MELGIRKIIKLRNRIRVHSCSFVADTLCSPQFIQNRREKLVYRFQEKEFQPRMNTNIHEFWRWNWESERSSNSGIGFVFIRVHSWPTLFWSPQFIQNRREKLIYRFQEKEFQ